MAAIQIIERLLTQALYHEKHVLYKAYPQSNIVKGNNIDDDDEDEGNKKGGMGMSIKKRPKKEKEEEVVDQDEVREGAVQIKPLFTFECADLTEGRQITCIDINSANQDLVAVGYGEYDINCIDDSKLKRGLLCFYTLKNPNFPELHIITEHSITCCAYAKRKKNMIAIGDSHGNIAIYNI